jgi:hypothetical protein
MNAAAQPPWWADRVFGLVSVMVGAILGFLAAQAKDWLDARRSKQSFLTAVANELSTVKKQLQRSHDELTDAQGRFNERGTPPQFAGVLSTTVFANQVAHLKSLSDPLVLDVVNFYSTLPVLEGIGKLINQEANEYLKLTEAHQRDHSAIRLRSALRVMLEEIERYLRNLDELRSKLPN